MSAGRAEQVGYTFRYDLAGRRMFVSGRDFDRDLIRAGEFIRQSMFPTPEAVIYADGADGVVWIIRHRVLRCLIDLWGIGPPQDTRQTSGSKELQ